MGRLFNNNLFIQENGGGQGGTTNYNDLTNKPAIDGVTLTKDTTKADLGITSDTDNNGIKGDYASKYGIINCQTGLISYSSTSKEVTVKAGMQLLMSGSDTKTQIGSDIKYTINSTSDVTLFIADGVIKEAEAVFYQKEEPENGQEAYLAWFNPTVGRWQFKSNADGNVWKTPEKATPIADAHLSETGVVRIDYVGYRILNDQIFALKSDIPTNAYTTDNLVAGKNITIEEVLPEGGIDNHTLACWHFDRKLTDEVKNEKFDSDLSATGYKKFGSGACLGYGSKIVYLTSNDSFTVDFWYRHGGTGASSRFIFGLNGINRNNTESNRLHIIYEESKGGLYLEGGAWSNTSIPVYNFIPVSDTFYHFALVYDNADREINLFLNGISIFNQSLSTSDKLFDSFVVDNSWRAGCDLDELRISDIARPLTPDGKFPVPTQPYSVAEPTGKVAINNAITKTSQLTNDSGFLTSVPENLVTTDTAQVISESKEFTRSIKLNAGAQVSSLSTTNNRTLFVMSGSSLFFNDYTQDANWRASEFNIITQNPNTAVVGRATLNGKQIATVDDIAAAASSSVASVNTKTGNVVLTGADIQTTYTYNSKETTTTVNAFADAVFHDIDNVTALIPTKAVTSDNVTKIVKLTQAEYEALKVKDDSTFYAIVG